MSRTPHGRDAVVAMIRSGRSRRLVRKGGSETAGNASAAVHGCIVDARYAQERDGAANPAQTNGQHGTRKSLSAVCLFRSSRGRGAPQSCRHAPSTTLAGLSPDRPTASAVKAELQLRVGLPDRASYM